MPKIGPFCGGPCGLSTNWPQPQTRFRPPAQGQAAQARPRRPGLWIPARRGGEPASPWPVRRLGRMGATCASSSRRGLESEEGAAMGRHQIS